MSELFAGCTSLLSIDLSNFDSSNVIDFHSMFKDCSHLTSINLSNFNTINVNKMDKLFSGCIKLEKLDISNFIISNVTSFNDIFKDCSSLKYLNLCKFQINENYINEISIKNIKNTFNVIPNDTVYCIKDNKTRNFLYSPNKIFTCEDTCYYENESYPSYEITEAIVDTTYNIQTTQKTKIIEEICYSYYFYFSYSNNR